jgi:hypothetical protein
VFEKTFGFFLGGHETLLRLRLRNAAPPDVGVCVGQRRRDENCSEDATLVLVERGEAPRALCDLWFDAPELKTMSADSLFDRITGKIVRRSVPGRDRTNLSPGTKLIWQIATGHVSDESSQTGF